MLSAIHQSTRGIRTRAPLRHLARRAVSTATTAEPSASKQKRAGDISDAFASLSGMSFEALEPRYADIKQRLIAGHEDAVRASWDRLLADLREEIPLIAQLGSKVVPEVNYKDIVEGRVSKQFEDEHRKRGVAVVRGVIDEQEVLGWKEDLKDYIKKNPHTRGKSGSSAILSVTRTA